MTTLLIVGLACVIAAVVGGGLKLMGVEIPILASLPRQILLAMVGIAVVAGSFVIPEARDTSQKQSVVSEPLQTPTTQTPAAQSLSPPFPISEDFPRQSEQAKIVLSVTYGPPGTSLKVSGSGFAPREDVRIRLHTQQVGSVIADDKGAFTDVTITIPRDWPFKGQYDVIATGEESIKQAREPFEVT